MKRTLFFLVINLCVSFALKAQPVNSVTYLKSGYAWAAGDNGYITKSTDKGITWRRIPNQITGNIRRIDFFDQQNGYLITGSFSSTLIYFTSDGGENWEKKSFNISNLSQIKLISKDTAIAVTINHSSGKFDILKTYNSGINWDTCLTRQLARDFPYSSPAYVGSSIYQNIDNSIYVVLINICVPSGHTPDKSDVYLTKDYGNSFDNIYFENHSFELTFLDKDVFLKSIGSGSDGIPSYYELYLTTDSGITFKNIGSFNHSIGFSNIISSDIIFLTMYNNILFTNNGGNTWNYLPEPPFVPVKFIMFDNQNGIIFSSSGERRTTRDGGITWSSTVGVTGEYKEIQPNDFELKQNFPNPFNPSTTISYTIPANEKIHTLAQHVNLIVYDILGRNVATLINQNQFPGDYSVAFNAHNLPSGTYFYTLTSNGHSKSNKMVLLK